MLKKKKKINGHRLVRRDYLKKRISIYIICKESPCTHCLAPTTTQSIPPHPSHYFCKQIPDNITFYPQIFQYIFLFLMFIVYIFILAVLGLHSCTCFSLAVVSEGYSLLQSTHYGGSSCYGAQALGRTGPRGSVAVVPRFQSTGSLVTVHGLSCFSASGIFPDQDLNLCLLHWQADSLPLSHQGSSSVRTSKG